MDTEAVLGHHYLARAVDDELHHRLRVAGAVVVEGPRACGKTMTGLHAAESCVFLDEPSSIALAQQAPSALLAGARPRLLDEWQLAPELWNLVRREVDRASRRGQFILTGSAVPADDVTRHTGAGRFLRLRMRTMSWWERGDSTGAVSLEALMSGERPQAAWESVELPQVIDCLARSGFPALRDLDGGDSVLAMAAYLEDVTRTDIHRLAQVRHAPEVLDHLIRSLARQTAAQVRVSTLAADLEQVAPGIRAETVTSYLELLERLFVVERVPAWTPSLRSRARLRTTSRLHLADPALATSALGASPTTLLADVRTTGFLFESAVVHDLQVYISSLGGRVHHYRDSSGREIDAVLTLPDGRWAAVEVKLGGRQASAGASSLARAVDQVDTEVQGEPVLRLVVTGTGPVLTMDDGTVTCPLSALGP